MTSYVKSLKELHTKLIPVYKEAEKLLLSGFHGKVVDREKDIGQDTMSIVTDTDILIDNFFRLHLTRLFPEIGFISEELEDTKLGEYNWIIDPIDGTLNFSRKIPICGISVGLWKGNQPVYGFLSLPLLNYRLFAIKNAGLFFQNKPVKIKAHSLAHQIYLYFAHTGKTDEKSRLLTMLTTKYNVPRSVSCAIFNGFMTALGNADATVYINHALWDIGAVYAIAREAGLACEFITQPPDLSKNNYHGYRHSLIIGQPKLVKRLVNDVIAILN